MLRDPAFDRMFAVAVDVLRPYLGDVVCIGGCANALYRWHDLASDPAPPYLGTKDSDWALPTRLTQRTEEPLATLMIVFRDNLAVLGRECAALRDRLPAPWLKRFERAIRSLFGTSTRRGPPPRSMSAKAPASAGRASRRTWSRGQWPRCSTPWASPDGDGRPSSANGS